MLPRLNSIIKSKIKSIVHEQNRMEISMNMDERCDACTYSRSQTEHNIRLEQVKRDERGEGGRDGAAAKLAGKPQDYWSSGVGLEIRRLTSV